MTDGSEQPPTLEELPDDHADPDRWEYRIRCDGGCHRGWVCWTDLVEWIEEHEEMGHDTTVSIREKQGPNSSDFARLPDNECPNCGSNNVPGQVICAVCRRSLI